MSEIQPIPKNTYLSNSTSSPAVLYAGCVIVLVLASAAGYLLVRNLVADLYHHRARNRLNAGRYLSVVEDLRTADRFRPEDSRIKLLMGQTYLKLSSRMPNVKTAYASATRARISLRESTALNPLDSEAALELARTTSRLQQLFPLYYPKRSFNPFDARPLFRRAITLRPNSIRCHFELARYMHQHNQIEELKTTVGELTRIYPAVYRHLRRESFWSPVLRLAAQNGLKQAITKNTMVATANRNLSAIHAKDANWQEALSHFHGALAASEGKITPDDYFRLGRLYLKNGKRQDAEFSFLKGLDTSPTRNRHVTSLVRLIQNEGAAPLIDLHARITSRFPYSIEVEMSFIRALMNLKQYNRSKDMLLAAMQRNPIAEGYYRLACIAEIQKDWNNMEPAIQKATVLAPANISYRKKLSHLLKRQKRWQAAEREIGSIIRLASPPAARWFNERATLRIKQENFEGAAKDWEEALKISPQKAVYHTRAGEAYIRLGNWSQAVHHYRLALDLEPDNAKYRQRLAALGADS